MVPRSVQLDPPILFVDYSSRMGSFSEGDLKGSWVALFVLFIIWWITYLPRMFYSFATTEDDSNKVKVGFVNSSHPITTLIMMRTIRMIMMV